MRFAVIGAGRIGAVHARTIASGAATQLAWVTDPVPGAADRLAAAHGARAARDVAGALADPTVDAIVVCSPTPTHVDLIRAGVAAGKAVLCEKPVDLSAARARDCAREVGSVPVMIGFNRRFDPSFAEIRARAADGEIGEVEQVTIVSRDPAAPPASYIASSGGLFKDMTIHDLDMARFLLGDIASVDATGQHMDRAIEAAGDIDGAVVTLRSRSGALAVVVNSRHCAYGYDQRLEVFGSTGMLEARNHLPTSVRAYGAGLTERATGYLDFFLQRYERAYAAELGAFVRAVEAGEAPSPSLADGVAALELAEAAATSLAEGRTVELPQDRAADVPQSPDAVGLPDGGSQAAS